MRAANFYLENGIDLQIELSPSGYQLLEVLSWNGERAESVKAVGGIHKDFAQTVQLIFHYELTKQETQSLQQTLALIEHTARELKAQVNEMMI